jgi:hypothetical protein
MLITPDIVPPLQPPTDPRLIVEGLPVSFDAAVKVAVTVRSASMVTLQAPIPEQAPPHPANVEPAAGTATGCTTVPAWNRAPEGNQVTVPFPLVVTLSVYGVDAGGSTSVRLSGGM